VIGYIPDSVAQQLRTGRGMTDDTLELPLEPGKRETRVRIRRADINEVRLGPSTEGHTGVQMVLKPDARYELVAESGAGDPLRSIADPAYWYGLGRLRWFVIYAGPIFRPVENGFQQVG
jgi:hypothetical protein